MVHRNTKETPPMAWGWGAVERDCVLAVGPDLTPRILPSELSGYVGEGCSLL